MAKNEYINEAGATDPTLRPPELDLRCGLACDLDPFDAAATSTKLTMGACIGYGTMRHAVLAHMPNAALGYPAEVDVYSSVTCDGPTQRGCGAVATTVVVQSGGSPTPGPGNPALWVVSAEINPAS